MYYPIATIRSNIHYSYRGIDLFPDCASLLTEPCNNDTPPIQST